MNVLIISHPTIGWKAGIFCDENQVLRKLRCLFTCFKTSIVKDSRLSLMNKVTVIKKDNENFVINGEDVVVNDISHLLGILMEILLSPEMLFSSEFLFLHGAALEKNGKLIMLIAPTYQGKSTTAGLLTMRGYRYLSDDVIPVKKYTHEVYSFPKTVCIRDISILQGTEYSAGLLCSTLPFSLKNANNIDGSIETRTPIIPTNSIHSSEGKCFSPKIIIFLERNLDLAFDEYQLIPLNKSDGYIRLIKSLRNPSQIREGIIELSRLTKKVKFFKCTFGQGFRYLNGIEELVK